MNIKNNFLLFLGFSLISIPTITQASELLAIIHRITNAAANGAVTHLQENGPKYIGIAVSTGITAIVANVINKRFNNTAIDSKLIEELKVILILKNKNDTLAFESSKNQLESIQQMQESQIQQQDFYQKREAVYLAQIDFYQCLMNKEKDCHLKRKKFEEASNKLQDDILNSSNIKGAL